MEDIAYKDLRPEATERSSFSGNYDLALLKDIAEVSSNQGIDPYIMIAIGLQESRLGEDYGDWAVKGGSVFNLESTPFTDKVWNELNTTFEKEKKELGWKQAYRRNSIRKAAAMFKEKERLAKHLYGKFRHREPTEAEVIQGWQGWGRIPFSKSFGKQKNLVGFRDVPHGKQVLQHVQSLKSNPAIRMLIEDIKGGN